MKDFVKRMVIEHKELCEKIDRLQNFVYDEKKANSVNRVDYANMCIQLNAMKTYANALECRINNQGIYIDETGEQRESVAGIYSVAGYDEGENVRIRFLPGEYDRVRIV